MNRHCFSVILGVTLTVPTLVAAAPGDELADKFFSKNNPTLTSQEKAAHANGKRWAAGSASGIKPVSGPNGAVRFLYGAQQPSIVCAVLQVCDVALQAGEQVNSINLGDTARWTVEPAIIPTSPRMNMVMRATLQWPAAMACAAWLTCSR